MFLALSIDTDPATFVAPELCMVYYIGVHFDAFARYGNHMFGHFETVKILTIASDPGHSLNFINYLVRSANP